MTRRQVANLPHISLFAPTTQARRGTEAVPTFKQVFELLRPAWKEGGRALGSPASSEARWRGERQRGGVVRQVFL